MKSPNTKPANPPQTTQEPPKTKQKSPDQAQTEPETEPKQRAFKRVRENGRPIKLTPAIQDKIVGFLRLGAYIETAVAGAGVPKATFYAWLKAANIAKNRIAEPGSTRATRKEKMMMGFLDAVEKNMAEAELVDLAHITQAAAKNWTAAAWRLERKFPEKWGRRDTISHTGPSGGPVETAVVPAPKVDLSKLSVEEVRAYRNLVAKAIGRPEQSPIASR